MVLTFSPSCSVELLKYLDLIVHTHRSFPSVNVWLRYNQGFPVPLILGSTDLAIFHQSYATSNVLQPAALLGQRFHCSEELPRRGKAQGSHSAAEICRTWSLHQRFRILQALPKCSVCHGPHRSIMLSPPEAISPIKFSVLASELRQHPSPTFHGYLISGFEQVFTIGFQLP